MKWFKFDGITENGRYLVWSNQAFAETEETKLIIKFLGKWSEVDIKNGGVKDLDSNKLYFGPIPNPPEDWIEWP